MFNTAAILREAHADAQSRLRRSRAWRTYRQAFADALRMAWVGAKRAAALAAFAAAEATRTVDLVDEAARAALRAEAWSQPFTSAGARVAASLYAEAAR